MLKNIAFDIFRLSHDQLRSIKILLNGGHIEGDIDSYWLVTAENNYLQFDRKQFKIFHDRKILLPEKIDDEVTYFHLSEEAKKSIKEKYDI